MFVSSAVLLLKNVRCHCSLQNSVSTRKNVCVPCGHKLTGANVVCESERFYRDWTRNNLFCAAIWFPDVTRRGPACSLSVSTISVNPTKDLFISHCPRISATILRPNIKQVNSISILASQPNFPPRQWWAGFEHGISGSSGLRAWVTLAHCEGPTEGQRKCRKSALFVVFFRLVPCYLSQLWTFRHVKAVTLCRTWPF